MSRSGVSGGHLYVSGGGQIEAFPIVNGILSTNPDRTYTSVPGFLAISKRGEFYSTTGPGYQSAELNTYSVQDDRLLSSLTVFPPEGGSPAFFAIVSVGLDAQQYIYVGVQGVTPGYPGHYAVEVYKPRAQGTSRPISIFLEGTRTAVAALTFDLQGNAFAALPQRDEVAVVSNPRSNPMIVRELRGGPLHGVSGGLEIDATDELYVGCGSRHGGYVLAYHASATSPTQVDRTIQLPVTGKYSDVLRLATRFDQLYVSVNSTIMELNKTLNGFQQPIVQLLGSGPQLAYGP
jgi:hypothetical protein